MGSGGKTGQRVGFPPTPRGAVTPAGAREGRSRGDRGRTEGGGIEAERAGPGSGLELGGSRAGLGSVVYGYSLRMMRMPRMKRTPAMVRPPIRRDW